MPVANAAYYEIEIQDVTGGTIGDVLDPTLAAGLSYASDQTLTYGHVYQWLVAAFDSEGLESAWSTPVTFQVPLARPRRSPGGEDTRDDSDVHLVCGDSAAGYRFELVDVTASGATVVGPVDVATTRTLRASC